jgi:hypothetical protein
MSTRPLALLGGGNGDYTFQNNFAEVQFSRVDLHHLVCKSWQSAGYLNNSQVIIWVAGLV